MFPATAAHAAEDVITVTTIAAAGPGSFKAALATANASTNPDGVRIDFAAALAGTGPINLAAVPVANNMWTTRLGATGGNHGGTVGELGARFAIDADVPVTVDFANLDGIVDADWDAAGIYVASDNVVLSNLDDLRTGAAGVAVSGTDVTIEGFTIVDNTSPNQEIGVALLNGATNVTLRDSALGSAWWANVLIDGSLNPAQQVTVSNIVIDNVTSRGVESGIGHIDIEDTTIVNGLTVSNSTFGAVTETHASHAVYLNTAVTLTDLSFVDNTVLRGAGVEKNGFYFEDATNTVITNTVISGNEFRGLSTAQPLSRVIGLNSATWNGLTYTDNYAEFTRGILMSGTITDAEFSWSSFVRTMEPSGAALLLGTSLDGVLVDRMDFDTVWAVDAIRVQGSDASNVVISNNTIDDFYADVSRSAIRLDATGTGNVVNDNELTQHLDRADGVDLPTTLANHWAIYNSANAADATSQVGWEILNNKIDGFGGNPAIMTQAPIVHNAIGKLPVTGNTFTANTRGSVDPEAEEGAFWLFWNVGDSVSNNTVQTLRAESVRYDGSVATFTAGQPANLPGNNTATAPVTLHVYWTAGGNAEEYLGAVTDVTPGERVAVGTSHTSGFLRVQTVDADGNTSQYSSIDEDIQVIPALPVVTETTETTAVGTGEPEATFTVRDVDGNVVATGPIDADGNWTATDLECSSVYTVTQTVGDATSEPVTFATAECVDPGTPTAPVVTDVTEETATGTGEPEATFTVRDEDGNVVATGPVDADGNWTASDLECGTTYTVTQTVGDATSAATTFTTADCVEPGTPTAPVVTDVTEETVTGTGDDEATFTVRDEDGNVVATGPVDADGNWTATGLECGTTYTVTQTVGDATSAATTFTTADCVEPVAPAAPVIEKVTEETVSGTGQEAATVFILDADGEVVASGTVDADGNWSIDISDLKCGTTFTAIQFANALDSEAVEFTTVACEDGGNGELPATGTGDLTGYLLAGFLVIAAGAGLLVARRRQV